MTPAEKLQLGAAIDGLLDVTTWWTVQTGGSVVDSSKRPRVDWESITDSSLVDIAARALGRAAHELDVMAKDLSTAVRMGSDYGAAFASVQAQDATAKRISISDRRRARARELRSEVQANGRPLSIEQIALRMTAERDAVDAAAGKPPTSAPIRSRTVERWLQDPKTPTGRCPVRPDDVQPE